jgi:hypothetical protein
MLSTYVDILILHGPIAHLREGQQVGPIAWRGHLWPTVAHSSTEAFYETNNTGRQSLYCRSIMRDLGIPQEVATILYEDNNGATAMANAGKPTSRTRHIDIKFYAIQEWVERDLVVLKRIDTSINMADHYTKPLPRILFYRHNDYNMGRVWKVKWYRICLHYF